MTTVARAESELAVKAVAVLKQHCWSCHGADMQKGGLRLDSREGVLKGGDNYAPAVVIGDSGKSSLYEFVSREDAELKMPPKGPSLSPDEVSTLKNWIDAGADWPKDAAGPSGSTHWSFQPLVRPPVPIDARMTGLRSPIDAFIQSRLNKEGLTTSPEADRRTLIRRLSFDLIGLPPTPEEVEAFVADADPLAYERLVDRLLGEPQFGERWARHWLDVVRFAESHGFEMNQARPNAWRYRDWVIEAFNSDLPYDQFIRQQLAGDQLGADEATGFLVGGAWDQVKSPDPVLTAQQRADELHDMISTTGSAFLGLTVGCARCHTHKFDPIPQTDYYAIKACLDGVQHGERGIRGSSQPDRLKRSESLQKELAALNRKISQFEPRVEPGRRIAIYTDDAARTARLFPPAGGPAKAAAGTDRGGADDAGDGVRLPNLGAGHLFWDTAAKPVFAWKPNVSGKFRVWVSWGSGYSTHAPDARYLLDQDGNWETLDDQREIAQADHRRFADGSGEPAGRSLWSGFKSAGVHALEANSQIALRNAQGGIVTADVLLLEEIVGDVSGNEPSRPTIRGPVSARRNVERFAPVTARYLRFSIQATTGAEPCLDELEVFTSGADSRNIALASAGTKATASSSLPGYPIHKLAHVNDGQYGNDWSWISNEPGRGWVQLEFARPQEIERVEWSRDRTEPPKFADRLATQYTIEVSQDGQTWTSVASSADRLPFRSGQSYPGPILTAGTTAAKPGELAALLTARRQAQVELEAMTAQPMSYSGKFMQPPPTLRLHRGDATQPREPVAPGSLTEFGAPLRLSGETPEHERRLALANWITDKRQPLTARVIVNRLWQHHFGEGIVATPSDFGLNGLRPSHPELIDWLASELIEHDWSLKHVHRLIVTSATYRQSSASRSDALQRDAGNRLLWRSSPRRLEAEPLRDAILSVSGQLDLRMHGPGFDLFEPNTNYVKVYTPRRTFGPAEFRRMVYQAKPRMQLEDTFGAFDCPDAGQVSPKRTTSTTPLQALNLLNSPFLLQQADYLADRVQREAAGTSSAQVRRAFSLVLLREPTSEELAGAETIVRQHGLPTLCRALLNASEFVVIE